MKMGPISFYYKNEGRVGFAPLNDLYLYEGKSNRDKTKKGQTAFP